MKTLVVAALVSALAVPAFAGGVGGKMADPVVEPRITPTPTPAPSMYDWTGAYVGALAGVGRVTTDRDSDDNQNGVGAALLAGYDHQFDGFVVGAEIDFSPAVLSDIGDDVNEVDSVTRLKAKVGAPVGATGNILPYATAGISHVRATLDGDSANDTGWLAGAGVAYGVTPNFSLNSELIYHRHSDFDGRGVDVEATTLTVGGAYRF